MGERARSDQMCVPAVRGLTAYGECRRDLTPRGETPCDVHLRFNAVRTSRHMVDVVALGAGLCACCADLLLNLELKIVAGFAHLLKRNKWIEVPIDRADRVDSRRLIHASTLADRSTLCQL